MTEHLHADTFSVLNTCIPNKVKLFFHEGEEKNPKYHRISSPILFCLYSNADHFVSVVVGYAGGSIKVPSAGTQRYPADDRMQKLLWNMLIA